MSTEEPPPAAPEPAPTPTPALAPATAPAPPAGAGGPQPNGPSTRLLLIIGGVIVLIVLVAFGLSQLSGMSTTTTADNYTVQPYKPPAQLISAGDRIVAYQHPDVHSAPVVMFGQGIALDVTGRVSRGLGNDWYAIAWNGGTAFVRQQDAIAGTPVAPPITAPRVPPLPPREDTLHTSESTDTEAPPAQAGPPDLTGVRWVHRPTQRDFQNAYPRRALFDGASGHVTLECTATGGGGLDCSIGDENPRGYGFGRAALDLSRKFRLEPTTPDGRSVEGGRIEVPVEFRSN